jgi:hypothetical protein
MREILDPVDPESLRPLFKSVFGAVQRGKALEEMVFIEGHYLLALDGTLYHASQEVHCDSCLERHHRNGTVTYSHQSSLQGSKGDVGRGPAAPRPARGHPADARSDHQARWHREKRL